MAKLRSSWPLSCRTMTCKRTRLGWSSLWSAFALHSRWTPSRPVSRSAHRRRLTDNDLLLLARFK
ncbi:hypothetical protein KCP75_09725 [Salmonella enterica subsp. enterica]|nr:hypothetical protein KCP75_09725 [Salmonella enterica subsp. enterica]